MLSKKDEAHRRKLDHSTDDMPSFGHRFNAILSDVYVRNKQVLDLGCWTGQMARILAPIAKSYTGIDPSPDAIEYAKKSVPKAHFLVGRAEKLSTNESSFDTVLMLDVIEHVPVNTEMKVYKLIHKALKPNGSLILTTPSSHVVSILLDPAYFLIGHRHYSEETLRNDLSKAGFEVKHVIVTGNLISLLAHNFELVCKHVLKRKITFFPFVQEYIKMGYETGGFAEIHLIAQKKSLSQR